MKHLIDGLHLIAMRRDGRVIVITATSIFILLLLALQNGEVAITMFDLKSLDFSRRVSLFFKTFFDITSTITVGATILAVLGSLLSAINIALVYVYIRLQRNSFLRVVSIVVLDLSLHFLVLDALHVVQHFSVYC